MTHHAGKVEQLATWKKNDGYFFKVLGKDWFGRGVPLFQAGQVIEWDSGEDWIKKAPSAIVWICPECHGAVHKALGKDYAKHIQDEQKEACQQMRERQDLERYVNEKPVKGTTA